MLSLFQTQVTKEAAESRKSSIASVQQAQTQEATAIKKTGVKVSTVDMVIHIFERPLGEPLKTYDNFTLTIIS